MKLPEISVKRPVATAMVFLAVLVFGLVSLRMLPLDVMPELEMPSLTVITVYPGASAEEVEEQVSDVLEATLSTAADLKKVSSTSKENVSFVQMSYSWGTDVTEAANNARDIIEGISAHLPDAARKPIIYKINSSMMPVIVYGVTAKENYHGLDKILEDKIAAQLRKAEGVGTVIFLGQPQREIEILVDPVKLDAYGLSLPQISALLKAENLSVPGGNIKIGKRDYSIHVEGSIDNVDAMSRIVLMEFNNKIIRLSDVAEIRDGFPADDEIARNNLGEGAALMVQKQSGENTLKVIRNVRKKMEEVRKDLPADVQIQEVLSTDEIVTESLSSLGSSLFWAFVFVILVVFIFLRDWKSSLIVFLTIPFSLIVGIIAMFVMGWTINIFSLMSLIIAIGMVVDNAIVVLENITQHIENGSRPEEAAIFGTSEMGRPIIASTLTTIMVFLPMVFMGGIVGILFKQLAVITVITMLASLFAALSLTPMISSRLLKGREKGKKRKHTALYRFSEKNLVFVEDSYKNMLSWTLNHKAITLVSAALVLVLVLLWGKNAGSDYIPEFDAGDLIVVMETPVGTSAAETDRVAQKVMQVIREEVPERIDGSLTEIAGQTNDGALTAVGFSEGKNVASILCHMVKPDERERTAQEIGEAVRLRVEQIPEIEKFHVTAGNILASAITGNEKPVEVNIYGSDFDEMNAVALEIEEKMKAVTGFMDIENTIDPGKLELSVDIDREKASVLGFNSTLIGLQVRQAIYGSDAGELKENGKRYDIAVRYDEDYRSKVSDLENLVLSNIRGQQFPLSALAEISVNYGSLDIEHIDQQRVVQLKAKTDGISLGEARDLAAECIEDIDLPQGVELELAGQISAQDDSFGDLGLVLILGILLVYMVMAGQFESFKHPFIIMLALPFMSVGVILAFKATGVTLSVTTFIGVIMLVGIVVNNGIVLVDYINLLRARGYAVKEAAAEAGRSRLRPVLMTSFTTILAMLPMAMSQGMGKEMFSPLGITIIGGLLISMLISLLIVPTLYVSMNREKSKVVE
jgi:hydrophobe/amphiphile efflux-1 (HAE1) family protein